MEIRRQLIAPCAPERLFPLLDDLEAYRQWMGMVHEVTAAPSDASAPTWEVELRARVGPFARSKRLRMVRTERIAPRRVVFERRETDGRAHAPWVLRAELDASTVDPTPTTRLTMTLTYGGALWTGLALERVLDEEVRRGSEALLAIVSREPTR